MCSGATMCCVSRIRIRTEKDSRFRVNAGPNHAGISIDNYACDTGFQFYGYDSHIYSIYQQRLQQSYLFNSYGYGNYLFDSIYSNPSEKSNRLYSSFSLSRTDSREEAYYEDMVFERGR